jgi:hypothetical protein
VGLPQGAVDLDVTIVARGLGTDQLVGPQPAAETVQKGAG